eukprot:5015378-Alexandrium_andersonii.AAC.1
MHPSGASGVDFEAVPGPSQFQIRTPKAMLHFMHGGLQIEADFSTDEHWAGCGLHFGHIAM